MQHCWARSQCSPYIDSTRFGTLLVPVHLPLAPDRGMIGGLLAYLGTSAAFRLQAWLSKHSASAVGWALGIVGFLLARDAAAVLFLC